MKRSTVALALSAAFATTPGMAQTSMEQKLQILQQEIDELRAQIQQVRAQKQQAPVVAAPGAAGVPDDPASRLDSGATKLFGYGEANYNRYRDSDRTSKADMRRFVFGIGHRFNDKLTFVGEVEYEHGVVSAGDRGEAEIEQAYLNYKFNDKLNVKAGLFLIPLGILNETHEPTTYYGVERNEIETRIIPTTWREMGFGVHGLIGEGLKYDVGMTTGFDANQPHLFKIQEGMEDANRIAATADTGHDRIRQPLGAIITIAHLIDSLTADDALKVTHHRRVGMGA